MMIVLVSFGDVMTAHMQILIMIRKNHQRFDKKSNKNSLLDILVNWMTVTKVSWTSLSLQGKRSAESLISALSWLALEEMIQCSNKKVIL